MKLFSSLFFFSLLSVLFVSSARAEEETLAQKDQKLIIERLRKAYIPLSFKFDGPWTVTLSDAQETWIWYFDKKSERWQWKCDGSKVDCNQWIPISFRWYGIGKTWLQSVEPQMRKGFDTKPLISSQAPKTDAVGVEGVEEDLTPGEEKLQFEGKRGAYEVWNFSSTFLEPKSLDVSISLADYRVGALAHSSMKEWIVWGSIPNSKMVGIKELLLERDAGDRIVLSRK